VGFDIHQVATDLLTMCLSAEESSDWSSFWPRDLRHWAATVDIIRHTLVWRLVNWTMLHWLQTHTVHSLVSQFTSTYTSQPLEKCTTFNEIFNRTLSFNFHYFPGPKWFSRSWNFHAGGHILSYRRDCLSACQQINDRLPWHLQSHLINLST